MSIRHPLSRCPDFQPVIDHHRPSSSRFGLVKGECRRAALVPADAGDGLGGQFVAAVLSKITFAPRGMVEGTSPEDVLARADHLLEVGVDILCLFEKTVKACRRHRPAVCVGSDERFKGMQALFRDVQDLCFSCWSLFYRCGRFKRRDTPSLVRGRAVLRVPSAIDGRHVVFLVASVTHNRPHSSNRSDIVQLRFFSFLLVPRRRCQRVSRWLIVFLQCRVPFLGLGLTVVVLSWDPLSSRASTWLSNYATRWQKQYFFRHDSSSFRTGQSAKMTFAQCIHSLPRRGDGQ